MPNIAVCCDINTYNLYTFFNQVICIQWSAIKKELRLTVTVLIYETKSN